MLYKVTNSWNRLLIENVILNYKCKRLFVSLYWNWVSFFSIKYERKVVLTDIRKKRKFLLNLLFIVDRNWPDSCHIMYLIHNEWLISCFNFLSFNLKLVSLFELISFIQLCYVIFFFLIYYYFTLNYSFFYFVLHFQVNIYMLYTVLFSLL